MTTASVQAVKTQTLNDILLEGTMFCIDSEVPLSTGALHVLPMRLAAFVYACCI